MDKMKTAALVLLALVSVSFSISFGPSVVRVERVWSVQGGGNYSFDGALVVNDSHQKVLSIETYPEMEITNDSMGNIRVSYRGNADTLRAIATVRVDFNTNLTTDPLLERRTLNYTNLTRWDGGIAAAAEGQKANSSLETIRNLVNFVHGYVKYNISYFGAVRPAIAVFAERQGVCVEYSHLLISMARHLGFETRFIGGYVNGGTWQPHAWAEIEVPGYGWLPADATFGEAGGLDSSHVARWIGEDQNSNLDRVESYSQVEFSVTDNTEFVSESRDAKGHNASYVLDGTTGILNVSLVNGRGEYLFGTYDLLLPEDMMANDSAVVLLKPKEKAVRSYQLDILALKPGYRYTVPISITFDDASVSDTMVMTMPEKYLPVGNSGGQEPACVSAFLPLFLVGYLFLSRH